MKKKILMIILFLLIIIVGIVFFAKREAPVGSEPKKTSGISNTEISNTKMSLVTSLEDEISDNTAWCGTFNLIWNDLKNELAKQDIIFEPQPEMVKNLNQGTFNTSYLSEDSYYKVYGVPSLQLKAEIEKAIKEKFDENSDILNDFDWENVSPEDYFLYAMLKKNFEFPKVFTELESGTFGNYENVKYFGIDESTEKQVREQVAVLYYNSEDDFAVKLLTKGNDEVILVKGNKANSFAKIYEEIMQKSENYEGAYDLAEGEILQIPNINFDLKKEIEEVEGKPFSFANGESYRISQALQTIQFELDKKGGKIKSEAGMMVNKMAVMEPTEPRKFLIDDTFTIFLKEQEKELPYFAAKISDISQVQKDTQKTANSEKPEETENAYFYGKIVESTKDFILVEPKEGENIRNSADKISIGLDGENDYMYEVGTNVKITYNGTIMETYPAQVEAIDIEIKSAENFEIRFYDKSYESQQKVRPILEKNESEKYDYNIFAYMGQVSILIDGEEMPLRDALLQNKIIMNEIIAKANQDLDAGKLDGDMYQDGGSMIYKYENYTIIKVHNLEGNRDVYIGTPNMTLNDLEV